MKKEVVLKKLQIEQEVDRFNFCLDTCTVIIEEFNEYLHQLQKAYEDYQDDINSEKAFREFFLEKERAIEELQRGLSSHQISMIKAYEDELDECEKDLKATTEVSRAYCAGPFNVGFITMTNLITKREERPRLE